MDLFHFNKIDTRAKLANKDLDYYINYDISTRKVIHSAFVKNPLKICSKDATKAYYEVWSFQHGDEQSCYYCSDEHVGEKIDHISLPQTKTVVKLYKRTRSLVVCTTSSHVPFINYERKQYMCIDCNAVLGNLDRQICPMRDNPDADPIHHVVADIKSGSYYCEDCSEIIYTNMMIQEIINRDGDRFTDINCHEGLSLYHTPTM